MDFARAPIQVARDDKVHRSFVIALAQMVDRREPTVNAIGRTVLVRGSGDVGSAIALLLHERGARVVIHDAVAPTYCRRGMAFVDAVFDGRGFLQGVLAKRVGDVAALAPMLACRKAIPIVTQAFSTALPVVRPDVVVDARMNKRVAPDSQIALAPLTIGIGPGFVAGLTTHVAVESAWGDALGNILREGATLPLHGEPRMLGGHGRARFLYAATAGVFRTRRFIGERVERGESVGDIDGVKLAAPLTGTLRGLTRDGVAVPVGCKVVEVDPRGVPDDAFRVGERPRRIAEAIARIVEQLRTRPVADDS